jgi:effector-binding domain-containing protein
LAPVTKTYFLNTCKTQKVSLLSALVKNNRMTTGKILQQTALISAILVFAACGGNAKKNTDQKADTSKPVIVAPVTTPAKPEEKQSAIINIQDTIATKATVLYMKDSAKIFERIGPKLAMIYGAKLGDFLKKSGIKMVGAPMAWYKTDKAPYFFEAGVPVNKKPAKLSANIYIREITADSVVVAHCYGPYNLLSQGYTALKDWMKDEQKKPNGAPYEIYTGDPIDKNGKPIDPFKVRTDIVFPRK